MDDQEFISRFEDGSFPFREWDHSAHLRLSYLYLVRYPFEEAMGRMRQGLQRLIRAHDIPETASSGYHETITRAWMHLVDAAIRQHGPTPSSDIFLERHAQLGDKRTLRLFYSPSRIFSELAKERFVEPDLVPLPQSGALTFDPVRIPDDAEWSLSRSGQENHTPC